MIEAGLTVLKNEFKNFSLPNLKEHFQLFKCSAPCPGLWRAYPKGDICIKKEGLGLQKGLLC